MPLGFTCAMIIAGKWQRAISESYTVRTIRPVTWSIHGSYCPWFSAFHATNCSPASFESFLSWLYTSVGEFNCLNTESNTFLDASGSCCHSSSSSETPSTSQCSGCRGLAYVGVHRVATTPFPVSTQRNVSMAAGPLHSWMVTEEARHQIMNCHFNDHCNCRVSYWDCYQEPCCG